MPVMHMAVKMGSEHDVDGDVVVVMPAEVVALVGSGMGSRSGSGGKGDSGSSPVPTVRLGSGIRQMNVGSWVSRNNQ